MKLKKLFTKKTSPDAKPGFTVVEITLVMAFIGLLLIAIATIFVNISAMYQKGLTLKTINSVGRNLVSELTTAINSAPSVDSVSLCNTISEPYRADCLDDGAYKFIYQDLTAPYQDPITHANSNIQQAGIFCTGDYSYVWNTYYGLHPEGNGLTIRYNNGNTLSDFKLVRFKDRTYRACSVSVADNYDLNLGHSIDISKLANGMPNTISDVQDGFLQTSEQDIDLDLYELTIFPISQDSVTLRAFFSGTFILATEKGDVSVTRSGDYCDVTNQGGAGDGSGNLLDLGSNFNYCGINRFNFAARTTGSGV